jgi:glycosyltransferase involved in cell wall biosynthesis
MPLQRDIIVFSHLRWNHVFQRPHHIVSRLAQDRKVLFFEEPTDPVTNKKQGDTEVKEIHKNLFVITPYVHWDSWAAMTPYYPPLVEQYTSKLNLQDPIFWFYSPYYIRLLNHFSPDLIVYDCMDELSKFKNGSPNLPAYEKQLLQNAQVVFTGGKSLYESKKEMHDNVFCFPSSVDSAHFSKALQKETKIPGDMVNIKHPVVGYYGVIDERLDMDLLKQVSRALPDVSFVLIGPVEKIHEKDIATGPNIFFPGKKNYEELPNYLKVFDVTMMPFALNEATRYISPTKTLEYMAALKPIISTPVYDVVRDYSNEVKIVRDVEQFVQAINFYLNESKEERSQREALQKRVIEHTSWDHTVAEMSAIINGYDLKKTA